MAGNDNLSATSDGPRELAYRPVVGPHDEMLAESGALRPQWRGLCGALADLGMAELNRRWEEARQLIREHGVTYNLHGDPRGLDRPWQLDPVPLMISAAEASAIAAGLVQRARLFEKVLADIHGRQDVLSRGLLPAELVFGNPSFLPPCHGVALPGNRHLHFYAADLGRAPDGSIWVLGDRTQAPSGAGYALENRIVMSRMLPEVFRDCQVDRLALFFRAFRETMRTAAPYNRDNPRIVLLTPGPSNETYFEHAYLARYLGYTLVEGADLTVRDNRVYQKLLGGLQPVDVILRRLDDHDCDPLELRGSSLVGVPGLVQAVHAGNVAIANPLGSGWMESPALVPYLAGLCKHLLGEDLKIRSVASWWCGEADGRDHVLSNLERMVIKHAFSPARFEPIFAGELSAADRTALAASICARPNEYVGQEQLNLSTAPVLVDEQLQPRHLVMRVFLTASGDSFAVMPGGLTRVTASAQTLVVSMQQGGGSKDTWVLASGPVSTFSLLQPAVQTVELTRGGGDLPSRAADNLFWLGRYVERAEGTVRLLRGILVRLTEKSGLADVPELPHLMRALSQQTQLFAGAGSSAAFSASEAELAAFLYDVRRSGSLAATLAELDRVAGMVRDRISMDMWRILSSLYLNETPTHAEANGPLDFPSLTLSDALELLNRTVQTLAAFGGLAADSMTRGYAWCFLDMGRRLERSAHLLSLLRSTVVQANDAEGPLVEALLEIADSWMTYRRRYLHHRSLAPLLDLLLADENNPRSLAFQLIAIGEQLDRLPHDPTLARRTPEQRVVLAGLTALRLADINDWIATDATGYRPRLAEALTRLADDLPVLSDAITLRFLSHLQPSRHLAEPGGSR
ncbi:MAG: hypothetical protein FJ271_08775 [Planctomycetes bacterium]|nr:hypothetical protein [Planctomycetota bacterium]